MASSEALKALGDEIVAQIKQEAAALGVRLTDDLEGVSAYAAERADHLSLAIGEPGFEAALKAERNNVAIMASIAAVSRADQIDRSLLTVAQGGLALAARAIRLLAGVPPTV